MTQSVVWIDGFDHHNTAALLALKYDAVLGAPSGASGGRTGTGRCNVQNNSNGQVPLFYKIVAASDEWAVGLAFQTPASGGGLEIREGATTHIRLTLPGAGGVLSVQRGPGTTGIGTGTTLVAGGIWHHVEILVKIATAGYFQVRLNGADEIHTAGSPVSANTMNGGTGQADRAVPFGSGTFSSNWIMDDFVVSNGTGSVFLGDTKVETLYPNGNGNSSVLVGSDGNSTDNYLLVDEPNAPNDDTDYVQSPTIGDKDTYAYSNLVTTSGTVLGVQISPYWRKDDAGLRQMASVVRHSGSEVVGPTATMTTGYDYATNMVAKPGGGAWTISEVNAAEFGVKVIA